MKSYKIPAKLLISVISLVVLTLVGVITFTGGTMLAPRLNGLAQAAMLPTTGTTTDQLSDAALQTGSDVLATYEQALTGIYKAALPSVVKINVTQKIDASTSPQFDHNFNQMPFNPFPSMPNQQQIPQYQQGQGSGFVWDKEGHIVTNYHVVENASSVEVVFANNTSAEATVLGTDPDADLAVLKVDLPSQDLQPLALGDSDALQPGQIAVAIGNPFGQEFTLTSGVISAVGRTIRSSNSQFSIPEVIQTDASINPGNSGGPLINRSGQVVGINTMILSESGSNAGIGFAVPINIAQQVIPTLIEGKPYQYAWLGISGADLTAEAADMMKLPAGTHGALVISVAQNGPADKAGLKGSDKTLTVNGQEYPIGGDVITAINNQPVNQMNDLITYLIDSAKPDQKITLTVIRQDGKPQNLNVTLGTRPQAK